MHKKQAIDQEPFWKCQKTPKKFGKGF